MHALEIKRLVLPMDYLFATDSIPSGVNDIKVEFRFPGNLTQSFEIESSARQHVIRLHDAGDVSHLQQFCFPRSTVSAATDVLRSLPDDLISEILKHLRNADIRTLRRVSRSWQHAFPSVVHRFPGCSQLPARKALWLSTLASGNAVAFLSNKTCNRNKLYSRVFRFAEKDIFPADLRMVASEAGLICMKGNIRKSQRNTSKTYVPHDLASPDAGDSSSGIRSSCRLIVCNPVLMDFRELPTFQDPSEDLLAKPEALIMNFGPQILEEKPQPKHFMKVGLVVDAHDLSYQVVVVTAKVQVFDSSCGDWRLGAGPPEGLFFPEDKMAVTYKACIYFVAHAGNVTPAPSDQVKWFIMRYDTKENTWQKLPAIQGVHHVDSWTVWQHRSLPDLVAMSDGVILVADNCDFTNKHIFRYNHANCGWDLIFHVPIFYRHISNFRHLKCIGTQMNLFVLLPNSFPLVEVDIGSQQWAWCLPGPLHNEQSMKTFLSTFSVTGTVAFEPSLHPVY
ncbi:hypothetical protein R1sor_025286 [Riccia sorocarpa]|uniref:F-box domain-containing protein n=1 Tax=Riccia sorocarpa TaxID=122646 RepID=A0ABD3G8Q5_9MARC